jgi:hypothetical protein|eukprot:COSAG06_NODE_3766_length_4928_cov_15.330917_2_plen_32_part_00
MGVAPAPFRDLTARGHPLLSAATAGSRAGST